MKNGMRSGRHHSSPILKTMAIQARFLLALPLRHQSQADSMIKRIVIALLVAHFLTAAYCFLWLIPGDYAMGSANYFIDRAEGMQRAWYYKFMAEQILHCVTYSSFAVISLKYSRKLFFAVALWNLYHYFDFICFLWNFHAWWWAYIVFGALIIAGLVLVWLPVKEKGKVISMQ